MSRIAHFFATTIYQARLGDGDLTAFLDQLRIACRAIAQQDVAGQAWSYDAGYLGYTSYGSIADLADEEAVFGVLSDRLVPHLQAFSDAVEFDLRGCHWQVDSMWINVLEEGASHTGHIHANSAISGTLYVDVPEGASAIRFEDPRLAMMIAAPPRLPAADPRNRQFVSIAPAAGDVVLWESWLRHEVPVNRATEDRISISFNAVLA